LQLLYLNSYLINVDISFQTLFLETIINTILELLSGRDNEYAKNNIRLHNSNPHL